jgi:hypothetical protein
MKSLARRSFLRGAGAALALPYFDAMAAPLKSAPSQPVRMAFLYVPNGIIMKDWTPEKEGRDFDFSRTLKPLEAYREHLNILTGLDHRNGDSLGDGAGDHARAGAT